MIFNLKIMGRKVEKVIQVIIIISLLITACKDENPVVQVDDGISWNQITGKLAYLKGNSLYFLDAETQTVESLGSTNLTNLKWNEKLQHITGVRFVDDSIYSIESINLVGEHSVLNNTLGTPYYDWLPDGNLVTFSNEGKILVNNHVLSNRIYNPVFGLACSPDGNKIVVSTDNIIENLLIEIDINTLNENILERNSNLFDPNFEQPIYSLESDKVFYVTYKIVFRFLRPSLYEYRVWSMPKRELGAGKDICRSDNLQRIIYTKVNEFNARIEGLHSIDIYNGDTVELIKGAHTPIWIY